MRGNRQFPRLLRKPTDVDENERSPLIHLDYHRYLNSEDSAAFIKSISQRYTVATLQRLASSGSQISRRAAVLALGFIGGYECNTALGLALSDEDRGVRLLAENGIRQVWCRAGTDQHRQQLGVVIRLNNSQQFAEAIDRATELIDDSRWLAEAWNQRAIAHFHLEQYDASIRDCHQALEINPYHFGAAAGMGQCYLELRDAPSALEAFRRALKLNPNLEGIRAQAARVERSLEGR